MSRGAKLAGLTVFVVTLLGVGGMALALLSIRSPLANGALAPGPEPTAYAIVAIAVVAGAGIAGTVAMLAVEGVRRLRR